MSKINSGPLLTGQLEWKQKKCEDFVKKVNEQAIAEGFTIEEAHLCARVWSGTLTKKTDEYLSRQKLEELK